VHAATVGRHDDGDGAAVRLVEDAHGLRSLRARSLKTQPDHGAERDIDGPAATDHQLGRALILGAVLFGTFCIVVANLFVDVLQVVVDPRILR
jgi:hypothetical protein